MLIIAKNDGFVNAIYSDTLDNLAKNCQSKENQGGTHGKDRFCQGYSNCGCLSTPVGNNGCARIDAWGLLVKLGITRFRPMTEADMEKIPSFGGPLSLMQGALVVYGSGALTKEHNSLGEQYLQKGPT